MTRSDLPPRTDVLIIGAGMSGLAMGRQLKRAGHENLVIAERADGPGGVWRANAYPGAACDVPSHLYSYSFFPNPDWSRKFAPQGEIKAYFERASVKFGLDPHIHYGRSVRELIYDSDVGLWKVRFEDGAQLEARVVISAVGQLSEPFSPSFEGQEAFKGRIVHTGEWTPDIDMTGKRVVMIGSAASAIQVLPHAAKAASELTVFQRTPNWVIPKPDRAFTPVEKWLFRHMPGYHWLYRMGSFALHESRWPAFRSGGLAAAYTRHRLSRRIRAEVQDPALLEKVLPDYAPGCKRILLSNDFFSTLGQSHVELVTDGVRRFTADGVMTGQGEEIKADLVILATGFKASEFLPSLDVIGRDGQSLTAVWGESPTAYKGVAMTGFPNLFTLYGPNTNLGHNSIIFMIERQTEFIRRQIVRLFRENARSMEVRPEAQAAYNADLQNRLEGTVWAGDCPSWYKSPDGIIVNNWSGPASRYAWAVSGQDRDAFALERA
ncbi:NAD(P)/FAD-dependent oxidoreductase [Oceanicaulis sp. MMSF_3324]|uniref:flavin-containing monooxygenase n=1 Tax=Oceanicaulis sp. MMSF_3324 TaxID=3046702 RepID=UPI00273DE013|nr:NAD(P)/FAD-dependent oxidoreductase [Oceanicaulis sp. MMSF_3324]